MKVISLAESFIRPAVLLFFFYALDFEEKYYSIAY